MAAVHEQGEEDMDGVSNAEGQPRWKAPRRDDRADAGPTNTGEAARSASAPEPSDHQRVVGGVFPAPAAQGVLVKLPPDVHSAAARPPRVRPLPKLIEPTRAHALAFRDVVQALCQVQGSECAA